MKGVPFQSKMVYTPFAGHYLRKNRRVPKVAPPPPPRKYRLAESNVNFRTFLVIPESSAPLERNGYPKVTSIFGLSFFGPL